MVKKRSVHVCRECGAQAATWTGRCSQCSRWGTVEEVEQRSDDGRLVAAVTEPLISFASQTSVPTPIGIPEVDRVLGGGLVPGSVTLLSGEPGIGKSTLTLQMACAVARTGAGVLLVTGEEAPSQVAARAARIGEIPSAISVLDETSVESIVSALEDERPALALVDSIQTLNVSSIVGSPGSVVQVRAAAAELVAVAKRLGVSLVLIGHVTKDGSLAGPRVLEHVVDSVLSFAGDRHHDLRFLRATKHRFGPTTDVGLFEMTGLGLMPVTDPSSRFLIDRLVGTPGSMVVPTLDGHRPVLAEVQALLSPHGERPVHIQSQGVDGTRVKLVTAVFEQRGPMATFGFDLFVSAAGGAEAKEPGADLAIGLAAASALAGRAVPPGLVACGEVGLSGEVRSVPRMEHRLQEAFRLGFRSAIVPASTTVGPTGLELLPVSTVSAALAMLDLVPMEVA